MPELGPHSHDILYHLAWCPLKQVPFYVGPFDRIGRLHTDYYDLRCNGCRKLIRMTNYTLKRMRLQDRDHDRNKSRNIWSTGTHCGGTQTVDMGQLGGVPK